MLIIPAIDIKDGKVVRLEQGASDRMKSYSDSPKDVAAIFVSSGARLIHIVDLDGAFSGRLKNLGIVKEIIRGLSCAFELGGGIRDEDMIEEALDSGVEKVVIGTRAIDERFIAKAVKRFGDRIVVGIDARDGIVHAKGWVVNTGTAADALVRKMKDLGIKTVNYTDISRDGMLNGPNIEGLNGILEIGGVDIVASGGISTVEDIKNLKPLEKKGLKGMIIGKAIYEGRIDLAEAIRIAGQSY